MTVRRSVVPREPLASWSTAERRNDPRADRETTMPNDSLEARLRELAPGAFRNRDDREADLAADETFAAICDARLAAFLAGEASDDAGGAP